MQGDDVRRCILQIAAIVFVGIGGCAVSRVDLVSDKSLLLVEKSPRGVHLEAQALAEDEDLVIRGTIHSEHANEVVDGHLHATVVEPSGKTFCDVRVSIREDRALARQLPKRGSFLVKIPGTPERGSTLTVEYHPQGM